MSELTARLKGLELVVEQRVQTLMAGLYRGYFGPDGFDMKGIRDYRLGDKPSRIHWGNSQRRGKLMVVDAEPELALRLGLVLDFNPGMFTGAIASKRETALRCFAVFAHLGTRHGNQAGALIAAEQELHVRMRQGITHARKLVEAAVAIKTPDGTPHRLHHALAVYPTTFKRNGLAVVISDLRSPRWQQELRLVARHREVMVIQIVDRRERTLEPGTKLANWRDPITGRVCTPDGSNDDQRRKYSAQCEAFLVETKEDVAGVGASHLVLETDKVETDEQLVDAIEQFLYARKLRKGDNHARVA